MYAVISDIHGNLEALRAVLDDVPSEVEEVFCLGDVVGYGASPDECANAVRQAGIPTISGNHDLAVADQGTDLGWFNPVAATAIEWTRQQMSPDNLSWLINLPRTMEREETLFVHGSPRDPDEYILDTRIAQENLEKLVEEHTGVRLCFFGHTHVKAIAPPPQKPVYESEPVDLRSGGPYLVNPGSVGQPRDGDTFASYILAAEGPQVTYRFVEYDIEKAQRRIRAAGLPSVLADRLAHGR